ncbi:transmembrane protein 98 isoform X2 [Parasteatoda tepidariorum]|nr:transmembrane protein 98 isoform X2 [Parasteatoda tepidariorum]XP_015918231.2 transmembrane protein 98 isoform X2 [Parasteatoda tepidariorum]XP_015918232.2 transmembrane protein 98 isoform X2 [Parasteatoda tepidariorum]
MGMEAVVLAAITVLTIVFVGSLFALIMICRHKYCRPFDLFSPQFKDARPEINLISNEDSADMELDDVRLHPNIEKILVDEQWVDDATGLIPHCLAILKKCHHLTERLVAMMMTRFSPESMQDLSEIIDVAKRISPRVDDVVRAMYPPLDPRLLEARCMALILSVSHLALIIRSLCQLRTSCSWVEAALTDMEENLQVLREAGMALEATASLQTNSLTNNSTDSINANNVNGNLVTKIV